MSKENFRLKVLFLLGPIVIIVLYVVFSSLLPQPNITIPQDVTNLLTLIVTVMLVGIAVFYLLRLMTSQTASRRRFSEKMTTLDQRLKTTEDALKKTQQTLLLQTHTFLVFESTKEIQIENTEGDGTIEYRFRCKNNPDKELDKINLNIVHDGALREDAIECNINSEQVRPANLQRLMLVDERTREPIGSMPNTLRFSIIPTKPIQPNEEFKYEYKYTIRKLYPKITTKFAEYTQTIIIHPTHRLRYIIKSPKNYTFDPDIKIEVIDRDDIEYVAEEKRLKEECPPLLLADATVLLWDIDELKLANLYRLYFAINAQKTQSKNIEHSSTT